MILVTGATGTVGSEVVKQLLDAGEKVRVLVRNPAKAAEKLGPNVEIARGDLERPETLDAAFAGVDKAFILSAGEDVPKLEGNAYAAAEKAGVKHIVNLSVQGADMEPGIALARWHRASEEKLKATTMAWTLLRPGNFSSNALMWAESIKSQGAVYYPTGEGKTVPIDPRDIAAVAVKALTTPGHEGKAYNLTGPEALSGAEQVAKISAAIGKPLTFVDVPDSVARDGMLKSGMPERLVDALMELMGIIRAGYTGTVQPTVEEVLGRKARTFDAWVQDNAAAFKS
jgi:(4-alkanoyl-5-oxo-2,5-dihydrofuran-3-yl)methyl phosphate reductase